MLKNFILDIWALLQGHFTVFKYSFKKRVTLEYPEKKLPLNDRFRGKHEWNKDSCIACKICMKVCPAGAISIENVNCNKNFSIDLNKCIFCGNCQYYCPKSAINLTKNYELATDNKSNLILNYNNVEDSGKEYHE